MPQLTVVVSLLVAGFVLFIWWRRRSEVLYGLFGLAALLWGIRTMTFVIDALPAAAWAVVAPDLPQRDRRLRHRDGAVHAALRRHPATLARARAGGLLGWSGPLWFALGGFAAEPLVARWWLGGMIPIGIC